VRACLATLKEELQLEQAGEELHIFTDRPKETLAVLMQECAIESATVRDATLEDVFLKLTGRRLRE
ncbi:MAG: ABC transporter ATP-binding protein, partial [Thermoplasmata archaeon]